MSTPLNSPVHHGAEKRPVSMVALKQNNEKADAASRRALNALSVTSDIVSALIRNPGTQGEHESLVNAARTMLRSADSTTQQLVAKLGLGGIDWAKYRLMKIVTSAVALQWSKTASDGNDTQPSADVSALLPVWLEIATHDLPLLIHDEPADNNRVALQIALLDAMTPVMREIDVFDMFHLPEVAALEARDLITAYAQTAVNTLVEPEVSQRSRNQLLQSLLRKAGDIYASVWRRHAEDVVENLKSMTPTQQKLVLEMNPEGLPLAPIQEAFAESYNRAIDMLLYLSVPKPAAQAVVKSEVPSVPDASVPPTVNNYFANDTDEILSSSITSPARNSYASFEDDLDMQETRVQSAA